MRARRAARAPASALGAWAEVGSSNQAGRMQVALLSPDRIGKDRCCQVWCRDPLHPDGTGVGLSDALRATFGS